MVVSWNHLQTMRTAFLTPNPALTTYSCCTPKAKINRRHRQRNQNFPNKTTTLSFKNPKPTPLLINHKPSPQTKLEALDKVVADLESSVANGINIDIETFASLLETCYHLRASDHGIRVHRLIPSRFLSKNIGIASKLLRLYASCGLIEEAHELFDKMPQRNVFAFPWNSLISGYVELGLYEDAIALYFQMEEEGVDPDRYTFPRVLKACSGIGSIQIGEAVHRHAVRSGFWNDTFVMNSLVDMYAKCGDIARARKVFDKIKSKDLVSWNSMLTGYAKHGLLVQALDVFRRMLQDGFEPDSFTISAVLSGSSSLKLGCQVHGWVIRKGIELDLSVANSLIAIYSINGMLEKASWLFHNMLERDLVSWNAIISGHSKHPDALVYYEQMERVRVIPDRITFVSLLSTCAHLGRVEDGEQLFSAMQEKFGINPSVEHYACMVDLYGRAGMVDEAYGMIVDEMELKPGPTVWGALLHACYLHGNVEIGELAAEKLFELEPDNEHNFELLIKIYGNAGRLDDVERVRMMLEERGLG